MRKLLKNRTLLAIGCMILSLLLFFGLGPAVIGQTAKQVQVTRVSKDIPKNTKITDAMLETVKIGGYNMPSGVVQNRGDIIGKYSKIEMLPGDYILNSKLSDQPLGADEYLAKLDGKKVAVSVSIKTFAAGLSGKLQAGDVISLDVADYGDMKQTITPENLQYVKLLAATADTGTDNDRTTVDKNANKNSTSNREDMPSTLTVLASPEQKKSLVDYDANGTIHASLVYRGDTQTAQKFLDIQDQYITTHPEGKNNEQ